MADLIYEKQIQDEQFASVLKSKPTLVPIPITKDREKKRGYNQSMILSKNIANKLDLKVLSCLERVKETRSQVGLTKKERGDNMKGAFRVNTKYKKQTTILLVDDVLTSGTTMNEAAKVLKKAGAKSVWALAFAKEN
jgi:ComF family protein